MAKKPEDPKTEASKPKYEVDTTHYDPAMAPQRGESPLLARLRRQGIDPVIIHNQKEWPIDFGHLVYDDEEGNQVKQGFTLGSKLDADVDFGEFPDVASPAMEIEFEKLAALMRSPAHRAVIESYDADRSFIFHPKAA